MLIKITLLSTILLYSFVISQSLFYILALSNVMKKMHLPAYIESRKLLDQNLRKSLVAVYYLALASSIVLVAFSVTNPSGPVFIGALVALVSLLVDIALTLKGNIPINNEINTWSVQKHPHNWAEIRTKWFMIYHTRQVVNITGFLALITGLVFGL